jgi:LPS O-antigen subunit length determinant protein (WzzB/FepE family)
MSHATMQNDEVYVLDLWHILAREWAWFLAGLLVVLLAVFAYAHTARRQWEATAFIQIGQVPAIQGTDPKVEPLARVLERLQLVPFQNHVLANLGIKEDAPEAKLYRKSVKLDPLPYAGPLVKFSVRGWSPEQARQFAEATVEELQVVHKALMAKPLALTQARLDQVSADLKAAEAERSQLLQAATPTGHDKDAQGAGVASMLLTATDAQIRELRQTQGELSIRLARNYTYETSLMWPVYVPQGPASPNLTLILGMGVLFGLSLGALAAIVRNALRRAHVATVSFNQTHA